MVEYYIFFKKNHNMFKKFIICYKINDICPEKGIILKNNVSTSNTVDFISCKEYIFKMVQYLL